MPGLRGVGLSGLASPTMSAGCPGGGLMSTILSYNPIAYWPLNELSGLTAINYGSLGAAANGTYSGVTLNQIDAPGGTRAGLYDGGNDIVNIYSAALAAAFNGQLGTIIIFHKIYDIGVLTDGLYRKTYQLYANGNNFIEAQKSSTNNIYQFYYKAGGTSESPGNQTITGTGWYLQATTWSLAANETKFYLNNAQMGTTQTSLGTWAGALSVAAVSIGGRYPATPQQLWYGYISHCAIFSSVLSLTQIQTIHSISGI